MMICTFTFLALLMDYGHSQFPDSTLNWWTWIFGILAIISTGIAMLQVNDMRVHFRTMPFSLVYPIVADLLLSAALTFSYSTFIL